ncbi:MAG: thioredoxin family protein [Planctomycetota bacterium]
MSVVGLIRQGAECSFSSPFQGMMELYMFKLLLAVALSTATSVDSPKNNYREAYQRSVEQEKPLMVVVSAPWCPACNVLKDTTIKTIEQSGDLEKVSFVVVDREAQPELAEELLRGDKLIPRIIMFTKSDTGRWRREELKGYQPTQPVRSLIQRAVGRVRR